VTTPDHDTIRARTLTPEALACRSDQRTANDMDLATLRALRRVLAENTQLRNALQSIHEAANVAHKGPDDTDADLLRQVAHRITNPDLHVGGSNVRDAASSTLEAVADTIDRFPLVVPVSARSGVES
jgi:hypothetical protein